MSNFLERAASLGRENGENDASWVEINNVAEALRIIRGHDDGDPVIMDMQPAPLSGEYSGDMTPLKLYQELGFEGSGSTVTAVEDTEFGSDLCDAYENAYSEAWWAEVIRRATWELNQ